MNYLNTNKEIIKFDAEYNILHYIPEIIIEIEFNNDLQLKHLIFYNPEKFYILFKNQINTTDFSEFYSKFIKPIEENPYLFEFFISNIDKFKEQLQSVIEKKEIFFPLRFYNIPDLPELSISSDKKQNLDIKKEIFVAFCNLIFLEEEKHHHNYKALLFIQNITKDNYFLKIISESSPIGLFLYRETFKFVNEEFCKISGYFKEELYKMPLWELAGESIREQIKQVALNRINGKLLEKHYSEAPLKTKSGEIKWVMVYANTILYQGKYHGLGIVIDITEKKLQEEKNKQLSHLYKTLTQIQDILLVKDNINEILQEICDVLIDSGQFLLVWIGKEKENKQIEPIIIKSKEEFYKNYINNLTISSDPESPFGKGPTGRVHRENQIIFNNYSFENKDMLPWLERLKQFNFNASCSIPIKTPEEILSINLYTDIKNYFNEEEVDLLYRIKANLEYSIYKIYQKQWLNILQLIIEKSPIELIITNEKNQIIFTNPYVEKLTGYSFDELQGKDPKIFSSHLYPKEFYKKLWNTILNKQPFNDLFINRKKNGELFYIQKSIIPIIENNRITKFASIGIDVTEKIKLEEQLQIKFLYDPVTKLPNRTFFIEELEHYLKLEAKPFILIDIDIYRFHYINDHYGIQIGDFYLRQFVSLS
ncbi:MAG: hypothetical protein KatS3mg129_0649 [Leptospiraceae bacterium]|nr:MAG: hypothetical protein KatS3mg129_0649 [Leptospiraceae bacterium]